MDNASVMQSRAAQMFPTLAPEDVDRLRRFGDRRTYDANARLVTAGEVSPGCSSSCAGGST
jgi:thioredoxin reductase (NADPH)